VTNEQPRPRRRLVHTLLPRNPTPADRRRFLDILNTPPGARLPAPEKGRAGEVWPEHDAT
jgi:hypothetical protein